jgi:hypothetical protein
VLHSSSRAGYRIEAINVRQGDPITSKGCLLTPDRSWQHRWLRINVLIREMTRTFRIRGARPILKAEMAKALRMKAEMKKARWWN